MSDPNVINFTQWKVEKHIVERVRDARVYSKPYAHMEVPEILPPSLYEQLLNSMPEQDRYEEMNEYASEGAAARFKFPLHGPKFEKLTKVEQSLWTSVRDALGSPTVKGAVFQALSKGLSYRYGVPEEEVEKIEAYPRLELYRETSGYSIKPHPDTRRKVVTFQVAFARDESQADLGTSIYRITANPLKILKSSRIFEEVKRAPFLPNHAFAFAVVNSVGLRSWHGCEPLRDDCGNRDTLLQIYYEDPAMTSPDIVAKFQSAQGTDDSQRKAA